MMKPHCGVMPFANVLSSRACMQAYAHSRHPEVD